MLGDFWFIGGMIMPFFIAVLIPTIIIESTQANSNDIFPIFLIFPILFWLLMLLVILNKDCVNGMSAAKRKFGFQVIDFKSKEVASDAQTILRNITMFLWPLEIILVILNPKRRLGDFIAGTEVKRTEKRTLESLTEELTHKVFNRKQILLSLIISMLLTLIASWDFII